MSYKDVVVQEKITKRVHYCDLTGKEIEPSEVVHRWGGFIFSQEAIDRIPRELRHTQTIMNRVLSAVNRHSSHGDWPELEALATGTWALYGFGPDEGEQAILRKAESQKAAFEFFLNEKSGSIGNKFFHIIDEGKVVFSATNVLRDRHIECGSHNLRSGDQVEILPESNFGTLKEIFLKNTHLLAEVTVSGDSAVVEVPLIRIRKVPTKPET